MQSYHCAVIMSTVRLSFVLLLFFTSSGISQSINNTIVANKTRSESVFFSKYFTVKETVQSIPISSASLSSVYTANESMISISKTPFISPSRMFHVQNTSSIFMSLSITPSMSSSSIVSSSRSFNRTRPTLVLPQSTISLEFESTLSPLLTKTPLTLSALLLSSESFQSSSSKVIMRTSTNYLTQSSSQAIRETNTLITTVSIAICPLLHKKILHIYRHLHRIICSSLESELVFPY